MHENGHGKLRARTGWVILPPAPSIAQPFGRNLEFGLDLRPATSESVFELDHPSFWKGFGCRQSPLWEVTVV